MISQLSGAVARAALVVLMILTPSVLLPGASDRAVEAILLIAIFAALFVMVEYGAIYPGLVEFRSAPPFNRVRFGILFVTLLLIAVACRAQADPTALARLVAAVGYLLGQAIDLPGTPVWLLMWLLPEGTTLSEAATVRTAAGLAYLVSLVGVTVFAILIRLHSWPSPSGAFNVWINLPTFDPTAGADVVAQLRRDGMINISLGLWLPYLTPPLALWISRSHGVSMFDSDVLLVWAIALWAFLPASLFLRGIAMRRLALMISQKRRRFEETEAAADPAFLPA